MRQRKALPGTRVDETTRSGTISREEFLEMVQHRAARAAVTAFATRGQGASGVVDSGREFMVHLDLGRFGTRDAEAFRHELDRATQALRRALPEGARSWGLARKLLNIFLRDCLYTIYLHNAYSLGRAEGFFEIPLDSITAKRISEKDLAIPRWPGVKRFDRKLSAAYQEAASLIASQLRLHRVHLDASWWGQR